jgi:drug/metabolite transporter (DMT)-like permease
MTSRPPTDWLAEEDVIDSNRWSLWYSMRVPLLAIAYCIVSISAVFLNKGILSRSGQFREFNSVEFLMLVQSILGSLFLLGCRAVHILSFPVRIDGHRISRIALVNILFVLMTCANAYSVKHLSLPMVALLKNLQVVIVCLLEYVFLDNRPGKMTVASLCVIVFGSFCGSVTDLEFNLLGYIWMGIAITSSAVYYISIKFAFKDSQVGEFTLVFYNNVLSIPFFFAASFGSFWKTLMYTIHGSWLLWGLILGSGFAGVGVNITTYLFLSASSPTSFSVLGVIKKITQTLLGYLTWSSPTNSGNVLSVCVGVLGGIAYTIAKRVEKP